MHAEHPLGHVVYECSVGASDLRSNVGLEIPVDDSIVPSLGEGFARPHDPPQLPRDALVRQVAPHERGHVEAQEGLLEGREEGLSPGRVPTREVEGGEGLEDFPEGAPHHRHPHPPPGRLVGKGDCRGVDGPASGEGPPELVHVAASAEQVVLALEESGEPEGS